MSELHTFIFEGLPVRGAIVQLTDGWQELLQRKARHAQEHTGHDMAVLPYPDPVRNLLGEMTAAAVLMHSNIKFNGSLIVQIVGGEQKDASPVKLAVAEVQSDFSFRATAKVVHDVQGDASLSTLVNASHQARCAITLVPHAQLQGPQTYQGIVSLYDERGSAFHSFAQVLEHYMLQSEQLDTKLVLAANAHTAVGILIQRMPIKGERNLAGTANSARSEDDALGKNEDFNRIATLTASIKQEELLTLSVDDILHRLFWSEPIARYAPMQPAPHFACSCSRERVANTIRNLGQSEAEKMVEDKNGITVNCDFCGEWYHFDPIDAAMLFMPDHSALPPSPLGAVH